MFHSLKFRAPVMSPFFRPHQSFDDITLDDIHPYFQPLRYPTNGESDLDTRLTLTVSLDSNPLEPSYPSYHMETDPSEPSYPSMIRLTPNSSSSFAASRLVLPPVRGCGFICISTMPRGHGRARGGGHGDVTPGGFGNGYLLPDE